MKHKPIVSAEEKHLFASGFRVTQGEHEFVTYPENTSIRIWSMYEADDLSSTSIPRWRSSSRSRAR